MPVGTLGAQAGCFIAAVGYRRPRHARTSRVLKVGQGASGTDEKAIDRKLTLFWEVF